MNEGKERNINVERKDLEQRQDIVRLVDTFYGKVKTDSLLAPVFQHVNWPAHLPIMYNFWSSMILGEQSYSGNPMQKHLLLQIGREHFSQWLFLWKQTVDDLFSGERADEIKMCADAIAGMMQIKKGLLS